MVVPIADRHIEYAERVRAALAEAGVRAEVDARSERMQAKLREAQLKVEKIVLSQDGSVGAEPAKLD